MRSVCGSTSVLHQCYTRILGGYAFCMWLYLGSPPMLYEDSEELCVLYVALPRFSTNVILGFWGAMLSI